MSRKTEQATLARRAELMREKLDAQGFLDGIAFSAADVDNLNAIAAGLPVAGAPNILSALRLKADYLAQKPAQRVDMRSVSIEVVDPYALPVAGNALAPELARPATSPALPPASAVAADRPRNAAELKRQEFEQAAALREAQTKPLPPEPPKPAPHFLEVTTPERERARVLASAREGGCG